MRGIKFSKPFFYSSSAIIKIDCLLLAAAAAAAADVVDKEESFVFMVNCVEGTNLPLVFQPKLAD